MRIIVFTFAFMASFTLFAQKSISGKPAKVTLPLPMSLWEYYATDSLSFVYNALGKLSMYGNCNGQPDGTVPGFNANQNALYQIAPYLGVSEGSVGYMLMEENGGGNEAIAAMKQIGMSALPATLTEYQKFARANTEGLNNGDEALNMKMWYYDSLIYAQMASEPDLSVLYNSFRSTGMFIRQDGQEFNPNANGTVRVATMKGVRLEEITLEKGIPTGSSYSTTATGNPASETIQKGTLVINKYFNPSNGSLASIDSTDTETGKSVSRSYYPNGKLSAVYSNSYQYGPDGSTSGGGSTEKAYYSNGQLACETETGYEGDFKIISAFDPKGKSTIKNGTGKISREMLDFETGVSTITTNAYVNHVQAGLNEVYTNGKLTSSFNLKEGLISGTQKMFHWKNGKIISEIIYDETGNYVSENNTFDKNAPKIDASKMKISVTVDPDMSCSSVGMYDPKFNRATLKNEKELKAALTKKPDLLHYNTDGLMPQDPATYKYLTLDVSEAGKPINTLEYTEKDAELIQMLQFNPATYQGKPIKARVSVNMIVNW